MQPWKPHHVANTGQWKDHLVGVLSGLPPQVPRLPTGQLSLGSRTSRDLASAATSKHAWRTVSSGHPVPTEVWSRQLPFASAEQPGPLQRLALQARPLHQYDVENCQFAGASTTPGHLIRPLKGHSAEWGAGAGERMMIIIMIRMMMMMMLTMMMMMLLQTRQLCAKDESLNIPIGRAN